MLSTFKGLVEQPKMFILGSDPKRPVGRTGQRIEALEVYTYKAC